MEALVVFAQKAVIVQNDRILLVQKSSKDPDNPSKWELPGGRMREAESLAEHLKREVWEEVGLSVVPGRPVEMWSWTLDRDGVTRRVVAVARWCDVDGGELSKAHRDLDDYLGEIEWVPLHRVMDLDIL